MLDSFLKFFELGLYHIISFSSYDHILFVALLTLPYVFKDWKRLLILISMFTLGHTLSLLLGVYDIINLNVNVTEWLIPLTIFFAAVFNIFTSGKPTDKRSFLILGVVLFLDSSTASVLPTLFKAWSAPVKVHFYPLLSLQWE